MGAVSILVSPLVHIYYPVKTDNYLLKEKFLNDKVNSIDESIFDLRKEYDLGLISAEEFIDQNDRLTLDLSNLTKRNDQILEKYVDENRLFGWKNPRKFLIAFGVRLPYLISAIIISILVFLINTKNKYLSRALFILQVGFYSSAFYQLLWVFWNSSDYPLDAYRVAFVLACIFASAIATYLLQYYKSTNVDILKSKIRYIMNLMINQAVDKGHIRDEIKYEDEIIFPALKKLDE